MWLPRSTTADGFETQLAVNHLGHFTLTCLLLPALLRSPSSRVVTVSSLAHRSAELDLTDLFYERRKYIATKVYAQSKLANLLFARELGRRLAESGSSTLSVAAHPGLASTHLFVSAFPNARRFGAIFARATSLLAQSPANACRPTLYAATMPNLRNGDYVGPKGWFGLWGAPGPAPSTQAAQDMTNAQALWDFSERATNVTADFGRARDTSMSVPRSGEVST
jgi:NAD(P)-dependent dehydrogenase (short-subunit alcohol dehydrogenase family)